MTLDHRVVDFAAYQHVGQRVPYQFADAQLTLRATAWAGIAVAMLSMSRHKIRTLVCHAQLCAGHPLLPS
jgi:hypothetical protein